MYHSNVIQNNENVDIKYGSHDTFQESPVIAMREHYYDSLTNMVLQCLNFIMIS
jgi:hypothetical protein